MGHSGHDYVARKLFYAVDPMNLNLGNGVTRKTRPTAWAHNGKTHTTYPDQNGQTSSGGDGIHRESETSTVLVGGPVGRPSDPYEALMVTRPHEEPVTDSESLDASQGRVDALLALLPPKQRAVVTMIALEGLSVRDAAEHLNIGKSQVDRDYQAAKRAMADLLGQPVLDVPGMAKFEEATVEALDEMASSEPPELGEYLTPAPVKADNPRVSDAEWQEYQSALAAVRKRRADDADYKTVRRVEKRLGLPSTFSPAWNGMAAQRQAS